jgi:RNA polymerase sigma-70 factor (sigma-E family)
MLEPNPSAAPSSAPGPVPAPTTSVLAMASGSSALGDLPRSARPARRPQQARSAQSAGRQPQQARSAWSAGRQLTAHEAVTQLYTSHTRSLVRLAALLVRDEPTAEEVVQECFIAMHDGWHRLRDKDKALSYLKQAVVNRCRSELRHRSMVQRNAPKPAPDMPSAEQDAMSLLERSAVIAALKALPDRQRQALVLRYYADLSEAQIAKTMGISQGAVKSHTARGVAALRTVLEQIA